MEVCARKEEGEAIRILEKGTENKEKTPGWGEQVNSNFKSIRIV